VPPQKSRRRDSLPPVTVARFEQVTLLIQRLATEKTSVFLAAMRDYQDQHRDATSRPLTHMEAASVAGTLAHQIGRDDVAAIAGEVQQSGLRAHESLEPRELLLAAGIRTAPAFLDVALQVCALIEMSADTFEHMCETGLLDDAVGDGAATLRNLPMSEARDRATAALEHFSRESTGQSLGEAVRLLTGTVGQALKQALDQSIASASSSSTRLVEPTGGLDEPSSTT
jgi:hypothetical protein